MDRLQQALQFRQTFLQPMIAPRTRFFPDEHKKAAEMQLSLIREEYRELVEALCNWMQCRKAAEYSEVAALLKQEVIKELCDVLFVCEQMAAFLGLDTNTAMLRVSESNMTKLDHNGEPIFNEMGKVMKGPNYVPPDLSDLI